MARATYQTWGDIKMGWNNMNMDNTLGGAAVVAVMLVFVYTYLKGKR